MEGGAAEVVGVATVFGIVVTKTVDLIRNALAGTPLAETRFKWLWNVLALGLGVLMALVWAVNMLDNYSSPDSRVQGVFGQVLTGLAIGGVASGYHELFDLLSGTAKRAKGYVPPSDEAADERAERREQERG